MWLSTCYISQSLEEGSANGNTLIEYGLTYETLNILKGEIITNFIVEHGINLRDEIKYLTSTPWKLYFDGSAYKEG